MNQPDLLLIQSGELLLRQFNENDTAFIISLLNSEGWLRFIGDRGIKTEEDALGYINNSLKKSYEQNGFGLLCVVRKSDGEKIGMCGLIKRPALDDIDIGFAFLAGFSGKGYGTKSSLLVLDEAKKIPGLQRLVAITNTDNVASIALLEKIGFAHEKNIFLPGDSTELCLFAHNWS